MSGGWANATVPHIRIATIKQASGFIGSPNKTRGVCRKVASLTSRRRELHPWPANLLFFIHQTTFARITS
jgi:hypothetical protein